MGKPAKRGRFPSKAQAPKDHVHIALCLNYSGTAFRGLQIQGHGPTHHTLEGVCVQAMKDIGLIARVDRGRPDGEQHHFARSCRTDRGVHAIRNLLSIFVHKDAFASLGAEAGICERMNAALPETIRIARVTVLAPNFVPRHCCNRRAYRYMIPVYALVPPCDSWEALASRHADFYATLEALTRHAGLRTIGGAPFFDLNDQTQTASLFPAGAPQWLSELRACLDKANHTLAAHFVGPHRFHNFSVDEVAFRGQSKVIKPNTDEAARSIYRCEVAARVFLLPVAAQGGVTVQEYDANRTLVADSTLASVPPYEGPSHLPYVMFQIEGNSFLFNMIRKVVGTVIAVCRGTSEGMVSTALSPEHRVCTPLAPGPYLYLSLSSYHGYDATIRDLPPERGLHTLQEEWGGPVVDLVERFAFDVIAKDVCDIDLHRVPPLDDLLLARDKARDAARPQWREEDAHLAGMKEYKPLADVAARKAPCSEMTAFLRKLRVHNWSVKHVPLPENSKAMLELKNKRARLEQAQAASADAVEQGEEDARTEPDVQRLSVVAAPDAVVSVAAESRPDAGDDGWTYVAPTEAEEGAMRQAQFLARWKRARPWEFNAEELEDDAGAVGDNDE